MMEDLAQLGIESLLDQYSAAAAIHGKATESSDLAKGKEAYEKLAAIYRELCRRGLDARRALLALLDDSDPGVRLWAASHTIELAPAEGERVLSALAEAPKRFLAFSAKATLKQWREGTLRFS